jgi:hypothetical protein
MAAILLAGAGRADPQQVRRGPAPSWAVASPLLPVPADVAGPIFTRRQDIIVHLSGENQANYTGSRIKILQSNALQLGNISIAWNPASGAPIVHEIKVYRDGQAIDVLQNASFEILRREDQLEAAKLDGVLTAVLRIPDLRVGDELEVDFTTFGSDPSLDHKESGLLFLTGGPAPGRYHLGLNWDPGQEPNIRMTPDMERAAQRSDRAIDFRFDNPPLVSPPNDAPLRYRWQRVVQYSDFADWAAVSRHFAPLFAKAATLTPNSPLKEEARRIAAAQPRPFDRAAAALKLVQQNVRYIYVGLNGGNLTPASADETWQRRFGDCKAKTALLLALLKELGIEAEAVLVNSNGMDDGLAQRLPMPQLFDHVLVRAHIEGATYWLDGTLPPVARPSAKPVYPVSQVLPLSARGSALEALPWSPPTVPDDITLYEIDARAGFDKPAHIVTTNITRGLPGLQQAFQYSAISAAQLLDAFRQRAVGDVWQSIDDVQWHYDEAAAASILKVSGTGTVDWQDDDNGAKSLALPGGGFNPPDRRVRATGQDRDAPFYSKPEYSCQVTTVRLPATTQPRQWSSKPSFTMHMFGRTYYRAWELRDGAIRMVRGSRVDQPEIDAATAQRDNDRIPSFDNSMGWISYDPAERSGSVGNGEHVPATYEMDWSAAAVPCLPAPQQPSKQLASVDGAIITADDVKAESAGSGHASADGEASRQAVQGIIDRYLLLAALPGSKSAQDFASMQPAQRRDREIALLAAYAKTLRDGLPPPTEAELRKTRTAHPNVFAARQLLTLDQIRFTPAREQVAKLSIIQHDHDLEAVTKHLHEIGIVFDRSSATLDTANLSIGLVKAINALPKGEPFVLPEKGLLTINVVTRREDAPRVKNDSEAITLWRSERASRLLADKLRSLRAHAVITYAAGFEPNVPPK